MRQSLRRIIQCAGLIIALAFLFTGYTSSPLASQNDPLTGVSAPAPLLDVKEPDSSTKASVAENYGKLPLSFEINNGQVDGAVKFLSRGNGYTLFLTSDELVLSLRHGSVERDEPDIPGKNPHSDESTQIKNEVIRLRNIGANPDPEITGLEELPGKSNYFIGNDPEKWRTDISNYAKVKVDDIYPGIDLVYYGNQRQLEYDWIVAPGADPYAIRFAVVSKVDPRIDAHGNLILDEKGEIRLNKPLIYQEKNGNRKEIAGEYVVLGRREVGIQANKYDTALPLVIDPVLSYSTYLGGSDSDGGTAIAVDLSGNAYVTGETGSIDFPVANPHQAIYSGGVYDAFVTKLNAAGNALIYSTYLGGNVLDMGYGIAADTFGNAYVTGGTDSTNFPMANSFQASMEGSHDAFITKLNAAGNALVYSTYLGGNDSDWGEEIAVDTSGSAYVTGYTWSTDFPAVNPFQASRGGMRDAFITKLNAAGNALVYSTYLGGSRYDYAHGIAVDTSGNAYVTGETGSIDFPTENPFQAIYRGGVYDAFVTKLNAAGNALVYSTYLGGSSPDFGNDIAIDTSGNAYVTGETESTDFPTENPFQASYGGGYSDVFVTKLSAIGDALVYSTYLGDSGDDYGYGIAIDASDNACITGRTYSTDFPTVNPFQAIYAGYGDVFATKLNTVGNALVYSTYIGGNGGDRGHGIAVDSSGNAYVTGHTWSTDFPVANAFQACYGGGGDDAFVIKIDERSNIFFPEIAVGGGWFTIFALINTCDIPTIGNLFLLDQQGNPLTVNSLELGTGSSFPFSILPGGTMFFTVDSLNPNDPAEHGWVRAEFWGGSLSGVATYRFESEGVVTALSGVLPSQPTQFATIPVDDNVSQARTTAYAIANPTDQTILIKICFVDTDGIVVDDTIAVQLDPGEQIARYFFQDLGLTEFIGSMVLRAQGDGRFLAVALNQNQDLFTVTPVEPSKAPNIPD